MNKEIPPPTTYWEKRSELAEEALYRLCSILMQAVPHPYAAMVRDHLNEWHDLIGKIED
jgi:hypothetical protein